MTAVTFQIPDIKLPFILELMDKLGIKTDNPEKGGFQITESQKELGKKELNKIKADPSYLLDWDEVNNNLNLLK